jgi:cell wall-associated NlpC family hydrolase
MRLERRTPGAVPTPPTAPEPAPEPTPLSVPRGGTDGFTIATAALQLQGIPYRLGGTDVHGFDCSGLVQHVFALYGIALPRVVHDQYRVGRRIGVDDLEPGDLVFFRRTATACRTWAMSSAAIASCTRRIHAASSAWIARLRLLGNTPSPAPGESAVRR